MIARSVLADDLGALVPVEQRPERIASLAPNLSELLADWGLTDRVIAVTEYCVEPADGFPDARRVRGTKNPDVAALIDLAPDLVLASEEENREVDVRRLRAAGLAVHVTRVHGLEDLPACIHRLGQVLGTPGPAAALTARWSRIRSVSKDGGPRVACALWRDTAPSGDDPGDWWLLGRATYGASIIAAAGGELVPTVEDDRYPRLPFAALVAARPDLVLLPDEPYRFGRLDLEVLSAHGLRGRIVDGKALWWWGPRTPGAVGSIARLLRGGQ